MSTTAPVTHDGNADHGKPAKFQHPPAVALNPAVIYPYAIDRMAESAASKALREAGAGMDHANMMGGPDVAALLRWQLRLTGAKRVLEVGCFRGSTALWLAEGLPADGEVVTLDVNAEYAEVGQAQWAAAGVADRIQLRVGPAVDTMSLMIREENQSETFDLVFIDADKVNYGAYYELALTLVKPNGVVAVDNTLWSGRVATVDPKDMDESTRSIAALNDKIKADSRVDAILLPIADGLTLVRKLP